MNPPIDNIKDVASPWQSKRNPPSDHPSPFAQGGPPTHILCNRHVCGMSGAHRRF